MPASDLWRSWRARAAWAFGLGVLVLVGALSLVLHAGTARRLVQEQTDTLATLSRSTAQSFAEALNERLREITLLAESPPGAGTPQAWARTLPRLQATREHFSWIGLVGADGAVRQATGGLLVGQSVAARPWFQAALRGPHVGDVHSAKLLASLLPAPANGEPLRFIDFAAPVADSAGRPTAVLGVHVDWSWAQQVIDAGHSPLARERGVLVWIFDRQGTLIHRPAGLPAAADPQALPGVTALPSEGAQVLRWSDGVEYLTAAHRLPARQAAADLGWTIVARQPLDSALAQARAARDTALAAGALAALLAACGAWWLAGRLGQPLAQIATAARAVQVGALNTEIPRLTGATELASLSDALRGMTQALREREHELERRVAARTAELRAAQAELQHQALHDALTGLHNRRAGDERLAQELTRHRRHGHSLALVLADIDHFKRINDTHGHGVGDQVLREVARQLRQHARRSDLVVRHGGEEFLILMPETDAAGAQVAAEKLRAAVERHAGTVPVTLSLGVASDAQAHAGADVALEAADRALYAAKSAGRNRVVMAAAPQPRASSRRETASS